MIKFSRSFVYAWQGIQYCYKTQLNFRVHLVILLLVIVAGIVCRISATEWALVIICSMIVLILEMLNTALEYLCNTITTDFHPAIKIIKDVSAGAVLIAAAGSVITGTVIFIPKIIILLKEYV